MHRNPDTENACARQLALAGLPPPAPATSRDAQGFAYHSKGHLLIVGPEDLASLAAERADGMRSVTLLVRGRVSNVEDAHLERALAAAPQRPRIHAPLVSLSGWLGAFRMVVRGSDGQDIEPAAALIGQEGFDLVLDLCEAPVIARELPPPGYVHCGPAADERVGEALAALASLVGEFGKPAYVEVDHALCAHAASGLTGCTRCLDVCPADAIQVRTRNLANEPLIAVDTGLCHGAGSCTTACPTGALSFALPRPAREWQRLQGLLETYRQAGGDRPAILVCAEHAAPALAALPASVLPLSCEEVGAIGAELWFALIAEGVRYVAIQLDAQTPPSLRALLERECALAAALLQALGHPPQRIALVEASTLPAALASLEWLDEVPAGGEPAQPIRYAGKRATLNQAFDRLYAQGMALDEPHALPPGSPFGQVRLDRGACTLCMSCVVMCPTRALRSGSEERPMLAFIESDCVQCGLCASACPERALTLEARFVPASGLRSEARTLNEEDPFCCIACGKPFATRSTIRHITQRLAGHSLYQGEAARRLQMCEDCRVRDNYRALAADPLAQVRP